MSRVWIRVSDADTGTVYDAQWDVGAESIETAMQRALDAGAAKRAVDASAKGH